MKFSSSAFCCNDVCTGSVRDILCKSTFAILTIQPLYRKGYSKKLNRYAEAFLRSPPVSRRDSVRSMNHCKRLIAATLITTLATPSLPLFAQSQSVSQEATIRVTRKATDQYAVSNSKITITTKYCHEYVRDEEAVLTTQAEGAENALLFATGAQCEVVNAVKADDSKFSLLDFLIQLGLMIATKGILGNPIPKPKQN